MIYKSGVIFGLISFVLNFSSLIFLSPFYIKKPEIIIGLVVIACIVIFGILLFSIADYLFKFKYKRKDVIFVIFATVLVNIIFMLDKTLKINQVLIYSLYAAIGLFFIFFETLKSKIKRFY